MNGEVVAQLAFKGPGGKSVGASSHPPTAEELEAHRPSAEVIRKMTRILLDMGFSVGDVGATSMTVTGSKELFGLIFNTTLQQKSHEAATAQSWQPTGPVEIPDSLSEWIDDALFQIPPELFP